MSPDTAMVFAAGRGTRMGALTADRPKAMIAVAGRPLIDHALELLAAHGVARAVVNTHHVPAPLHAHLAAETRLDVQISHENELLETGGGLRHALPLLGKGPVWTLNADAVWRGPNPLAPLAGALPMAAARLLLVPRAAARGHTGPGDFFLEDSGHLRWRGSAPHAPYVYTGLQVIDPAPAANIPGPAFSLHAIWDQLLDSRRLFGAVYAGQWCDVGRPENIALAEAMLRDG
ncbi:MAG: nucleotidyltransferase family protein [Pseudomonadota bacterium]